MNSSEKLADNIYKKFRLSILFLIVSAIIFVSCRVNKAYERPEIATGEKFRGQATADTLSIADKQWKEIFTDTRLTALIDSGISNNYDLLIAVNRLDVAHKRMRQLDDRGYLIPEVVPPMVLPVA